MRKNKAAQTTKDISILVLDDDRIMTLTLQSYFQASGYRVDIENDPYRAIQRIRENPYDILLLDFLMTPICGDQVVEQLRTFNQDIFIILLTGHKSMAPPIKTIRELDIQGYYEKSDRFDQLELLVESCVKSIRQLNLIRSYQDGLRQMLDILPQIYKLQSVQEIGDTICSGMASFFPAAEGFLCLDFGTFLKEHLPLQLAEPYFVRSVGRQPPPTREEIENYRGLLGDQPMAVLPNMLLAPLITTNQNTISLLGLHLKQEPKQYQLQLFELYARQVSAALSNIGLHMLLQQKNQALGLAYEQLQQANLEIISAMRHIVDAKDIYTRGHSDRVAYLAKRIAQTMGKDEPFCERVHLAGLFHDIGKLGIADEILLADTRLKPEQLEIIRQHPINGCNILSIIRLFKDILPAVRSHHEFYDGSGYPDGLQGMDIPEEARIISVADAFDAMTSNRRYRASLGYEQAVTEILAGRGGQFDPHIVDVFLDLLADYPSIQADLAWTYDDTESKRGTLA